MMNVSSLESANDLLSLHEIAKSLGFDLDEASTIIEKEEFGRVTPSPYNRIPLPLDSYDWRDELLALAATIIDEPKDLGIQISSLRAEPIPTELPKFPKKAILRDQVLHGKFLPGQITDELAFERMRQALEESHLETPEYCTCELVGKKVEADSWAIDNCNRCRKLIRKR